MTGQALLSTSHGVIGLLWIGGEKESSYGTGMQVQESAL